MNLIELKQIRKLYGIDKMIHKDYIGKNILRKEARLCFYL